MDPLKAGELRHRLRVERVVEADDGYGNTVSDEYAVLFTISAKVESQKGGEAVQAARLVSSGPVAVWVRSDSQTRQITPADRLVDVRTGAVFDVHHVLDDQERTILLTCSKAQ